MNKNKYDFKSPEMKRFDQAVKALINTPPINERRTVIRKITYALQCAKENREIKRGEKLDEELIKKVKFWSKQWTSEQMTKFQWEYDEAREKDEKKKRENKEIGKSWWWFYGHVVEEVEHYWKKNNTCFFCGSETPNKKGSFDGEWIKENQFRNEKGQILREVYVGGTSRKETDREIIDTVYYCSMDCMQKQQDEEEREGWKKGKCKDCGVDLIVVNEWCKSEEHEREAHLLPIQTPECMKKPKIEDCWEKETKKYLYSEVLSKEKQEREELMEQITRDLLLMGNNPICEDCRTRTLNLFNEWKRK